MTDTIKTLTGTHPDLVATIHQDPDPESPAEWETIYHIAYLKKSRNVLGTEATRVEGMDAIGRKVRDGEYIGIPVWAYVHSGATIQAAYTNPFSCPWDSGRSGWVYCSKADALKDARRVRMSPELLATVHDAMRGFVKDFDTYLQGDVYGVVVKNRKTDSQVHSCWGIYGHDNAVKEAEEMLAHAAKEQPLQGVLALEGGAP
jgi:hypothetical protein